MDGEDILLSEKVDEAFVDATLRLLADPAFRERLGRAAREKVLAQYSWRAQVGKMVRIYEELGV